MKDKHLHIISFDVPWPADYGGVIDVYYQIKALAKEGVKVHLHTYAYGREAAQELNELCYSVDYYPRRTGWLSNLSTTPYIIRSRRSGRMIKNLLKDDYPILCQGMHTCGLLTDKRLANRRIAYRAANVEHFYYQALYRKEKNRKKMLFFMHEASRLKKWEKNLERADVIFAISEADEAYYKNRFPNMEVINLFAFFEASEFQMKPGKGEYILYQGNLSVNENIVAVEYLLDDIVADIKLPLIVSGKNPPIELVERIDKLHNVELISNPSHDEMQSLIANAQANLLITFQPTGLKLKLLNALYNGRFCVANNEMLHGSGLQDIVRIANSSEEIISEVNSLSDLDFQEEDVIRRKALLSKLYAVDPRINKLIKAMF